MHDISSNNLYIFTCSLNPPISKQLFFQSYIYFYEIILISLVGMSMVSISFAIIMASLLRNGKRVENKISSISQSS